MPKFNATSSSDSSLPWSLYGSLPCSKVTVLPSGRNVTSTVFSPGASTVVVPVPCVFSSDIRPLGCKLAFYFYYPLILNLLSQLDFQIATFTCDRRIPWPY